MNKLKHGLCKTVKTFIEVVEVEKIENDFTEEGIENAIEEEEGTEEKQEEKGKRRPRIKKEALKKKCKKILEDFTYTRKNISVIEEYLDRENAFKLEEFDEGELVFLEECIEFIQGGTKYIEHFSKLCITYKEYKRAYRFIANNIENESITGEERIQLRKLQSDITYAMKKEMAVELIYDGVDVDEVMRQTGITTVDALKIRNRKLRQNQYCEGLETPDNKGEGK